MATRSVRSKVCTVIGGCGFLGRHMVEGLLRRGYRINVFDIKVTFEAEGVTFFTGDLCNKQELLPALSGTSIVFHCASPPAALDDRSLFYRVNVQGTETLIEACHEAGVQKLVLTSSASVVYDGSDIRNGTEELPYATHPLDYYTVTKILQEKIVLRANQSDATTSQQLLTVAIRPHGIFGPRDVQNVPTVAKATKDGKMKFIIGDGNNLVDFTYVDNVVHGHILAAETLSKGSPHGGKAYNITNDAPLPFWDYIRHITSGLGYPPPSIYLPYYLVLLVAMMMQLCVWLLRPFIKVTPTFTPTRVRLAGTHHYYSCEKAKKDFGYAPVVTYEEGIKRTLDAFKYLKNRN